MAIFPKNNFYGLIGPHILELRFHRFGSAAKSQRRGASLSEKIFLPATVQVPDLIYRH